MAPGLISQVLYYTILISLPFQNIWSQAGFFNSITIDGSLSLDFDDIILENNTIYLSGNTFAEDSHLWSQMIAAYDTSGVLLWNNTFTDSFKLFDIVNQSSTRFLVLEDNSLIIPYYVFNRNTIGLFVLDSLRNLLSNKEYIYDGLTIFTRDIVKYEDNIYLFGLIQRTNYRDDIYVIKINSDYGQEWIKYYGSGEYQDNFGDVINNLDGSFTISATTYTNEYAIMPFGSEGWRRPWIFTINTEGQILDDWKGEMNDTKTLGGGPICKIINDDILICSREFKTVVVNGEELSVSLPTISKLDNNYNLRWRKQLTPGIGFWDYITDMEIDTSNSEIVILGQKVIYTETNKSKLAPWILKLNFDGNILWSFGDTIRNTSLNLGKCYSSGLVISETGSIIATGYVEGYNPRRDFGWLIKITADGCFDTACIVTSVKPLIEHPNFKFYPNPVNNSLKIETAELVLRVEIYDMVGNRLLLEQVDNSDKVVFINCSNFETGIYFCKCIYKGGKYTINQFLIER